MTSVVTLAPMAAQLARSVSLDALFPGGAVEQILRDQSEHAQGPGDAELSENIKPFFGHYCVLVRAATALLAAPAFRSLARFHDEVEDEYMPGGPPQSPVYDSFAMQFVLGSVPQGIGNETPHSVLARLLLRDPSRARLQRMAQSLADARFELYRVKSATSSRAELEPVRGSGALRVWLTGPFLCAGDFGLMRVLPFDNELFIADSPYLLKASERDWLDHLDRIVSQRTPSPATSSAKSAKLSSKEQARRRQKDKAKAARNEPEEVIKRYLQFGLSDRYWFDYIMDAYAGERRGIVFLAGVPDRPELLPHSAEYQDSPEPDLPPQLQFRRALLQTAMKEGLLDLALTELGRLAGDAQAAQPSPNEQGVLAAYATFGLRAKDGTTVLARFERSPGAASAHPEVRSFIDNLNNGWFSVFRVDRIHLDKGLDVFDLLREQKLQITERSATRQLALGDWLLGWICKDPAGTITLEGGLAHIPSFVAPPLLTLVEQLKRAMPPLTDEQAWKHSAAELPVPLIAGILELRSNPPLPELVNMSGDPIELVTGHYRISDHARVAAALPREFTENGDGSYGWVDAAGTSLARLDLAGNRLSVQVNSRKRLKAVQKRLEALLGDAVERGLAAHEDIEQAMRASKAGKTPPQSPPLEVSPELAAQLHELVLANIRSTLDASIPQFKGKTLRQLARSAKTRSDAISWLREQERILKSNPQLAGLDMRPLWQELSLPFQGLETDPRAR
jgi:hypothetical protein